MRERKRCTTVHVGCNEGQIVYHETENKVYMLYATRNKSFIMRQVTKCTCQMQLGTDRASRDRGKGVQLYMLDATRAKSCIM
jgi:hypothetical protein